MGALYDDIECPYCMHSFDLNHDDGAYYSEDKGEECECPECDKTFLVFSSVSWHHEGVAADCLNGSPHEWEKWRWLWDYDGTDTDRHGKALYRRKCDSCDELFDFEEAL